MNWRDLLGSLPKLPEPPSATGPSEEAAPSTPRMEPAESPDDPMYALMDREERRLRAVERAEEMRRRKNP